MISIYNIAERCKYALTAGDIQVLVSEVVDAYGTVVRNSFYEGKADGVSELNGEFIYTFGKTNPLIPVLDTDTNQYYIEIPSSYINLPHQYGINTVSYMQSQSMPFVLITVGSSGMWRNIKAGLLGGRQTCFVEGERMYFPKMTADLVGNILLKLGVALDEILAEDVDKPLNIAPNIVDQIVAMVVAKFTPKPQVETKATV